MARRVQRELMSLDDLYRMPDDEWKHELQAGMLVSEPLPGSRHGRVASRVAELLGGHARRNRIGVVFTNDTGFVLSRSPDTVRGPDVAFVSRERFEAIGDLATAFPGPPDLAVEVLSPTNTPAGIHAKVADYLAAGTSLVWVVDPETETVDVYRTLLFPTTLVGEDTLEGDNVVPGFRASVSELFEV